jgi:cell wall-associated NlpC family hydrolase
MGLKSQIRMKNKVLATMLVIVMIFSSMPVFATPNDEELSESRQKYAEIEEKIVDIQNKIYDLDTQIEPLQITVEKNKKEIESINKVVENTQKEIEQYKKEISDLDIALGQRVKAMYTSGNLEFNYLNFIIESDSTTDFFSRIQAVTKIVGKDKESIEKIDAKKEELNIKINSLKDKKEEINKLNKEVKDTLSELDSKKKEQQFLSEETKKERSKFDSEYLSQLELEAVKFQFDTIDNTNSTSGEIEGAINQLVSIKNNQIKSPIVAKEIDEELEKAKVLASQKKVAEEKEAKRREKEAQEQQQLVTSNTKSSSKQSSSLITATGGGSAQAILNEAYEQLGKPYVWGATGESTFDCSGFTQYVYKHAAGIDISRTTYTQINVGQPVSQNELKPGDLVFPHTGHVGIYVGNGQMIHAPQTGDVIKVAPVYSFYAARRIL